MKRILPLMLTCIVLISCLIFPASAKEGTEGNELQVLQPEQLEIHLGAELAGAQFSLKTDAGMYPGTVAADANGILKLEIGGSSAYVLTRLDPAATAVPMSASPESTEGTSPEASESAEITAATEPTASKIEDRLRFLPSMCPASMGPPETKMVGTLTLAAAIRRPGTFLSQLGIMTRPSNPCAFAIHSVESAMRSRVTREYFIPT